MAENKTKPTAASVGKFINGIKDAQQREDSLTLLEMMKKASKEEPVLWGAALIGFGNRTVTSPSGRTVEWLRIGFSPRKAAISVYISGDIQKQHAAELKKLGKHKTGMGWEAFNTSIAQVVDEGPSFRNSCSRYRRSGVR